MTVQFNRTRNRSMGGTLTFAAWRLGCLWLRCRLPVVGARSSGRLASHTLIAYHRG